MKRIDATPEAIKVIEILEQEFGELLFYQAGGCCEGTQPQCFEKKYFNLRTNDACIGFVKGYGFWLDRDLFEYWKHAHFTLDVMEGIGAGGFSLETPYEKTFIIKYRLFTKEELENLEPVIYNNDFLMSS